MAQQTTVRYIDDLDGSEAQGSVEFGLDGRSYSIDLSEENAAKLRTALAPFIEASRKPGGRGGASDRAQRRSGQQTEKKSARSNREETAAIRQWAREHGHQVSDRGRIPTSVLEAYESAS
jgi:Lsr2